MENGLMFGDPGATEFINPLIIINYGFTVGLWVYFFGAVFRNKGGQRANDNKKGGNEITPF